MMHKVCQGNEALMWTVPKLDAIHQASCAASLCFVVCMFSIVSVSVCSVLLVLVFVVVIICDIVISLCLFEFL